MPALWNRIFWWSEGFPSRQRESQPIAASPFFTDTHFGEDKPVDSAKQLAERINRLEPDLVIFGGDLLDNYARDREQMDLELLREQLSGINAPDGKYAVWGNHDWGGGAARIYQEFMESCGFQVLKNESLLLEKYQIQILGYDDYLTGDLEGQLPYFAEGMFPLLVAHEPYTAELLFDLPEQVLMLSGHTHPMAGRSEFHGSRGRFSLRAPADLCAGCMRWMRPKNPPGSM